MSNGPLGACLVGWAARGLGWGRNEDVDLL